MEETVGSWKMLTNFEFRGLKGAQFSVRKIEGARRGSALQRWSQEDQELNIILSHT